MQRAVAYSGLTSWGAAGYYAYGTTQPRAIKHLQLLVAWHDAPNGWRTWLAELRLNIHNRFFF